VCVRGGKLILFVTVNAVTKQFHTTVIKILSKVHAIQYFWKEYLVKLSTLFTPILFKYCQSMFKTEI